MKRDYGIERANPIDIRFVDTNPAKPRVRSACFSGRSECLDSLQIMKRRDESLLGRIVVDDELYLQETIEVVAVFRAGFRPCRPVKFRRASGREVVITEVGLGYPHERGSRTVHVFDVTDGQADYRLEFDSITLVWRLTREADHVS